MTTISQTLLNAKQQLKQITDQPALEAEVLLAHVLQQSRSYLHAYPEQTLTENQQTSYQQLIIRRLNNEPIAYIIGKKEFWSLELTVTPDVLIPRPETELLIETILQHYPDKNSKLTIADLGTGSGAIAIALAHERPHWEIIATDQSEKALNIAKQNAMQLGQQQIQFYLGNWCEALPHNNFDIIVSNPPYLAETEWPEYAFGLAHEPRTALLSDKDGLADIRTILLSAKNYLKKAGMLAIEHGFKQGQAVRELFWQNQFQSVRTIKDLSANERITIGQK